MHSIYAAIDSCIHHDLNLLVVFLADKDSSLWQCRVQWHSCTVRSHITKIYISCQKLYCAGYTSIYQTVFTSYYSLFAHNISQTETRRILSYFFFTPLFLLVSVVLTVTKVLSACRFDFRVGRINPGIIGTALTSHCCGHTGFSMQLPYSMSYSTSAAQSSSLTFGLSKSPFQSC